MAYTLGNKYAKNLCKRTVLLNRIIENVVTCFLEHSVVSDCNVYHIHRESERRRCAFIHNFAQY